MSPEHKEKMRLGREASEKRKRDAELAAERGEPPAPDFTSISTKPRSLPDIFQFYSIGDGKHFVQVVRTHPKRFFEQNVAGVQKPIRESITEAEFATIYGGAEYELRVYAFDERADGTPFSKPLTDPILYRIPGPPNLESAITEEDDMRYAVANRRMVGADRVAPNFEAPPVAMRRIQSQETMDERDHARARERRQEEADTRRDEEERELRALDKVVEVKDRELQRLEASKERELKMAREVEASKSATEIARLEARNNQPDQLQSLKLAKELFAPNGEATAQQLQSLVESHKNEITRAHGEHDKQLKAERDRADTRIKDADDRADRRIKDAEEKFEGRRREIEESSNRRISEVEQRAEARVRETERQADQRLQDLDRQHNNRFSDLKDNHARELRAKDSEAIMGKTQVEVILNARVATLESDAKRLETELARARREADQYRKDSEDWLGKLEKFNMQAEAMGFVRPEDAGGDGEEGAIPKTWQEMLATVGMKFISNMPEVIEAAGKALSGARQGGANPEMQRQLQRQQMISGAQGTVPHAMAGMPHARQMVQQPLPFATEDGVGFIPMDAQPPRPTMHMPPPHDTAPQMPLIQHAPMMHVPPQQMAMVPEAPPPQAHPAARAQQPRPAPPQTAPAQAPAPEMSGDGAELDPMIFGLAAYYDQKVAPAEVVNNLLAAVAPEQRDYLRMMTFDTVISMISQRKHEAAQKLLRREGQKYLKSVWSTLQTELAK